MSYLLEALGRGLLGRLLDAFEGQLPGGEDDDLETLAGRRADSPTSTDLAIRFGTACLKSLRLAEARAAFESALELGSGGPHAALGLACVYDELGRDDQTLLYLSVAQAYDPDDPAIAFAIAMCHERREQSAAAIVSYERALTLCPQLRNAHERLAAMAVRRGDWDEAIRRYEQLAKLEPGDLDVLLTLATLQLQRGQPLEAIEKFQRTLLIEPECCDGPLDAAGSLVEKGRIAEAVATLEKLIEKYPGVSEFRVHLGDLYVKTGQDTRAVEQYRAALDLHPNFLEATVKLGTQHLRQGRYADAAQAFNRAVELNDRLLVAFVGLGVAQDASGRRHEARATFDLATSLEPNSTLLFSETARLHLKAEVRRQRARLRIPWSPIGEDGPDDELIMEALRRHRQALANHPNYADLHYRYGLLLRQMGEFDQAIGAFRNAIAINPHYVKALIKLGICLKETGQGAEAIDAFRQALTLKQGYVDVHYQLGLLFAQQARFDLAVEEFEQAVAGNGQNITFRQNLALALQNIGMVDRAAATWDSICELSRQDEGLLPEPGSSLSDRPQP